VPELPLVSIVTPSLNQRRFIEATIESVLSQDYPRIEYIVVDGGSTDGTLETLKRYEGRLLCIAGPDRGQSDAINKGFRRAHGEILAWLNSDDTYMPGAVSSAVTYLTANPACAMVYGDGHLIDEHGRFIRPFHASGPFDLWRLVYVLDYILQQSAFFQRHALEAVGGLDERLNWGMDWDLFIKLGKRFPIGYLPQPMANLREHGTAKTLSGGTRRLSELVEVMHRHGGRRYPPARLAYAADTYVRLVLGDLQEPGSATWAPFLRARRFLARGAYGLIDRACRRAQGLYDDGWIGPRAHFMLRPRPATRLVVQGRLPNVPRMRRSLRVTAAVNGIGLGPRDVPAAEAFDAAWRLPASVADGEVVEVELRCKPVTRPSPRPFRGDRRRLGFQLQALMLE
jgi:glycosyltransferase involved in cell wall biosynthesis